MHIRSSVLSEHNPAINVSARFASCMWCNFDHPPTLLAGKVMGVKNKHCPAAGTGAGGTNYSQGSGYDTGTAVNGTWQISRY